MAQNARVFISGRSQHVTIPREFRFRSSVVSIRRDSKTGSVILSEVPNLDDVFAVLDTVQLPEDFMAGADRDLRPLQFDALFAEEKDCEEKF